MAINHNDFDGKQEDHFKQTSIHLSFTAYEVAVITDDRSHHMIDRPVVLLETLVSIYDGGTWVGEVDILKSFRSEVVRVKAVSINSTHRVHKHPDIGGLTYQQACTSYPQLRATSVENWDELIEAPSVGNIAIRAHKNRLARLAAVSQHHVIADADAVTLRQVGRGDDLVYRDLLVDGVQDALRSRLDAERESLAPGEAHLAEELFAQEG